MALTLPAVALGCAIEVVGELVPPVGPVTTRSVRSNVPAAARTAITSPTAAAPRKVKKTLERRLVRFMVHTLVGPG